MDAAERRALCQKFNRYTKAVSSAQWLNDGPGTYVVLICFLGYDMGAKPRFPATSAVLTFASRNMYVAVFWKGVE